MRHPRDHGCTVLGCTEVFGLVYLRRMPSTHQVSRRFAFIRIFFVFSHEITASWPNVCLICFGNQYAKDSPLANAMDMRCAVPNTFWRLKRVDIRHQPQALAKWPAGVSLPTCHRCLWTFRVNFQSAHLILWGGLLPTAIPAVVASKHKGPAGGLS